MYVCKQRFKIDEQSEKNKINSFECRERRRKTGKMYSTKKEHFLLKLVRTALKYLKNCYKNFKI